MAVVVLEPCGLFGYPVGARIGGWHTPIKSATLKGRRTSQSELELEVERRRAAAERMLGLFADVAPGRSLVDELIADRRAEAQAGRPGGRGSPSACRALEAAAALDASALLAVLRKEEGAGIVKRGDRTRSGDKRRQLGRDAFDARDGGSGPRAGGGNIAQGRRVQASSRSSH